MLQRLIVFLLTITNTETSMTVNGLYTRKKYISTTRTTLIMSYSQESGIPFIFLLLSFHHSVKTRFPQALAGFHTFFKRYRKSKIKPGDFDYVTGSLQGYPTEQEKFEIIFEELEGMEGLIAGFELQVVASPFLKGGDPETEMAVNLSSPFKLPFEVQRTTM